MKKTISVILAVVMIISAMFCFTACSDDAANKDDNKGANNAATATIAPDADTSKGVLKMATNAYFQPYEYYEGDKIVGIDAEIAEAIAKYLGKELVIEDMEFDSIITAVQNGSVDFGMAGMTVTPDRLESINFRNSYATGVQSIIVKEGSPITKADDLFANGGQPIF